MATEGAGSAGSTARRLGTFARMSGLVRNVRFRAERKAAARLGDVELRQLKSLEKAYSGATGTPLLIFGDSSMMWTAPKDTDPRHLVEMIRDDLGGVELEALVGPGYNPRIVMAYLTALEHCRSRPKVALVPTSTLFAMSTWLGHPVLGYELVAQGIRDAISGPRPKKLERPGDDLLDAYDRLPAPSLIGARRTVGELRLITNATPQGRWQQVVRLRALMDFYNAERLEPDSPGVLLVAELGAQLKALGIPGVAIIPPLNHEVIVKTLGAKALEHIQRNAAIIETAFQDSMGEMGSVVNAVLDCPATEFIDPLHLSEHGRSRLAARITTAVRPHLEGAL